MNKEFPVYQQEIFRQVSKEGIKYLSHTYWHRELITFILPGSKVTIRVFPDASIPKQIKVFYQGKYICTARKITERND